MTDGGPMAATTTSTEETSTMSPPAPLKRLKTNLDELEETREQMLEQQNQLLREEISRLKQANEVSQDRVQKLEGSLEKSMKPPLNPEELGPRARELFLQLVEQAELVEDWDGSEVWFQSVHEALAECPSIAQAAVRPQNRLNYKTFLLAEACVHLCNFGNDADIDERNEKFPYLAVFQLLVKACPSALLWEYLDCSEFQYEDRSTRCIHEIAGGFGITHRNCFDLLLWSADEYGWIFNLSESFAVPAHTELLTRYVEDGSSVVDALFSFFKSQPRFLKLLVQVQSEYEYPIHIVLQHLDRIAANLEPLVRLMVSSFPESLGMGDDVGNTPLHLACEAMACVVTDPPVMGEIIVNCARSLAILVEQYPKAVSFADNYNTLPIEYVGEGYDHPDCQDSVILLLRAYFPRDLTKHMKNDEFFPRAYALVEEEARFGRLCVRLKFCSKIIEKFAQLASPSDNSSALESDEDDNDNGPHVIHQIYSLWASKHIAGISAKFETEYARLKKEFATLRPEDQA